MRASSARCGDVTLVAGVWGYGQLETDRVPTGPDHQRRQSDDVSPMRIGGRGSQDLQSPQPLQSRITGRPQSVSRSTVKRSHEIGLYRTFVSEHRFQKQSTHRRKVKGS